MKASQESPRHPQAEHKSGVSCVDDFYLHYWVQFYGISRRTTPQLTNPVEAPSSPYWIPVGAMSSTTGLSRHIVTRWDNPSNSRISRTTRARARSQARLAGSLVVPKARHHYMPGSRGAVKHLPKHCLQVDIVAIQLRKQCIHLIMQSVWSWPGGPCRRKDMTWIHVPLWP